MTDEDGREAESTSADEAPQSISPDVAEEDARHKEAPAAVAAALHKPASAAAETQPESGEVIEPSTPPGTSQVESEEEAEPATGGHDNAAGSEGPEGQPFERGGRWWFRRDGELLVYDDVTSEWKSAPPTGSSAGVSAAPGMGASEDRAAQEEVFRGAAATSTIERGQPVEDRALRPRPEGATSWKCPTCGATNGSTAEGCRLCFTARP